MVFNADIVRSACGLIVALTQSAACLIYFGSGRPSLGGCISGEDSNDREDDKGALHDDRLICYISIQNRT